MFSDQINSGRVVLVYIPSLWKETEISRIFLGQIILASIEVEYIFKMSILINCRSILLKTHIYFHGKPVPDIE